LKENKKEIDDKVDPLGIIFAIISNIGYGMTGPTIKLIYNRDS